MASLLGKELFEINGQGPPPAKDFFQLIVTKDEVIWKSWRISVRVECRGAPPREVKISHQDFTSNKVLKQQVSTVFGHRILDYTISLCEGEFDYLERLPDELLLRIMSYIQLKETPIVAGVSKRFRKLCNSEMFWEHTVRNRCAEFTSDMEGLANAMGWRKTYFTFFHNGGSKQQK